MKGAQLNGRRGMSLARGEGADTPGSTVYGRGSQEMHRKFGFEEARRFGVESLG